MIYTFGAKAKTAVRFISYMPLPLFMGRIRTTLIKRTGKHLFQKYGDKFKADFEHNKKALGEVAEVHSKKLRNILAGYITKLANEAEWSC